MNSCPYNPLLYGQGIVKKKLQNFLFLHKKLFAVFLVLVEEVCQHIGHLWRIHDRTHDIRICQFKGGVQRRRFKEVNTKDWPFA